MRKIFTLAALVGLAYTLNAQEIWRAADYDLSNATLTTLTQGIYSGGTAEGPDTSMPGELKSSTIVITTANVKLTGESTPNADKNLESAPAAWELKGSVDGNDALITDLCSPKFAQYLMGQGNPELTSWYFTEETENGEAFRVYGTYWEPGNDMPAKGLYWKFEPTANGSIKAAIYGNKNQNPTYIVDAETKQPLPCNDIDVAIYYQNTGFAFEGSEDEGTAKYFNEGKMPEDYVLQHVNGITQNRPVLGYVTFPVEAGKTYYIFNPKSQVGLYGFEFNSNGAGIAGIAADSNAPVEYYNLQGVRVDNPENGLYIKVQGNKAAKVIF